jgi:hypothetical protein
MSIRNLNILWESLSKGKFSNCFIILGIAENSHVISIFLRNHALSCQDNPDVAGDRLETQIKYKFRYRVQNSLQNTTQYHHGRNRLETLSKFIHIRKLQCEIHKT